MGITTEPTPTRRLFDVAEQIAEQLGAQRLELYRFERDAALIEASAGMAGYPTDPRVPLTWFPWSLGNIRSEEYVFIRNAGVLPTGPGSPLTLDDLGLVSALHVPVVDEIGRPVGAIAAYWCEECESWDTSLRESICSSAFAVLSQRN